MERRSRVFQSSLDLLWGPLRPSGLVSCPFLPRLSHCPSGWKPKVPSPRVPSWSSEVGVGFGLAPNCVTTGDVYLATELISQVEAT